MDKLVLQSHRVVMEYIFIENGPGTATITDGHLSVVLMWTGLRTKCL